MGSACSAQPDVESLAGRWEITAGQHPDPSTWQSLSWRPIQAPFGRQANLSTDGWITIRRTLSPMLAARAQAGETLGFRTQFLSFDIVRLYCRCGRRAGRSGIRPALPGRNRLVHTAGDVLINRRVPPVKLGDFASAGIYFDEVVRALPDDLLARDYQHRTRALASAPTPPGWTGVLDSAPG